MLKTNITGIKKSKPWEVAYLTVLFAAPFTSGSPLHAIYLLVCLSLFVAYVFFILPKPQSTLTQYLKNKMPIIFYACVAFLLCALVSTVRVFNVEVSPYHKILLMLQSALYIFITLYIFALVRFIHIKNINASAVFAAYMLGVLVLITQLLVLYLFFDAPNIGEWGIHPPLGGHVRLMGMIAAVAVITNSIFLLVKATHALPKMAILIITSPIYMAFLIWTGSRATLVFCLLCLTGLLITQCYFKKLQLKRLLLVACLFLLAIPLAEKTSILPWMGFHRMVEASQSNNPTILSTSEAVDTVTSGRLKIWQLSAQALERQYWFGYGPNGYFFLPERQEDFIHPHNIVIQVLIEWGLLGGSLLLFILAGLVFFVIKQLPLAIRSGNVNYLIPAFIVLMLSFNALTDGVFFVAEPLFCMATAIAWLLASNKIIDVRDNT